jgi:hypothetical protein
MTDQVILFANNATSRLAYDTPRGSSTVTVEPGFGVLFPTPNPATGYFFMVTLEDRRTSQVEICKCTERNGDVLTVLRGQENTLAQDFFIGATVSNRLTAGTLIAFQDHVNNAAGWSRTEADDRFVNVDGDTMLGSLYLNADPTQDMHAANRRYVDDGLATKAPLDHVHPISEVIDLQAELDEKIEEAPSDGSPYARQSAGWVITITKTEYDNTTLIIDGRLDSLESRLDYLEDFVTATTIGDAPLDGEFYGRQSGSWERLPSTYSGVLIADNPPIVQYPGYLWWDSNSGIMYLRVHDVDSAQWVQVNNPPVSGTATGVVMSAERPLMPRPGQLWFETGARKLWIWFATADTAEWIPV